MNNIERVQHDLENRDVNRGDLVVVGSSAGGVEALSFWSVHCLRISPLLSCLRNTWTPAARVTLMLFYAGVPPFL